MVELGLRLWLRRFGKVKRFKRYLVGKMVRVWGLGNGGVRLGG